VSPTRPLDCHERALGLLAVRARSRRELESRLLRAGFAAPEVADELDRLETVGLVDDEAFARQVAEHELVNRRSGRRAIVSRLASKGIGREAIDLVLGELAGEPEEARAIELARTRTRRLRALAPERAYGRLVAFLGRHGYDPEVARSAATIALRMEGFDGP
jgi:SOS response regulatory protein OraA/RecX